MRTAWLLASGITVFVVVVAVALLPRTTWSAPEQPPRAQGEALALYPDGNWNYRADLPSIGIREPQNTWTNLAYLLVGLVIGLLAQSAASRVLGLALCFLALGSGLYHASATDYWRLVDVIGMYWAIFLMVILSIEAVTGLDGFTGPGVTLMVSAAAIAAAILRNDIRIGGVKLFDSTYVAVAGFGAVAVGLLVVMGRGCDRATALRVVICLLVAALAVFGRLGDQPKGIWFNPDGLIQGHAVWHVASAVAVFLAVDGFRRQKLMPRQLT